MSSERTEKGFVRDRRFTDAAWDAAAYGEKREKKGS